MIFNGQFTRTTGHRSAAVRVVASVTAAAMLWLAGPAAAFGKGRPAPVPKSRIKAGLTDKITPELQRKIDAQKAAQAAQAAAAAKPKADVRVLSAAEMRGMSGRGPLRNASFSGTLPWQRSLRDVNLCNGNLFKSFTDIQVAPAHGAGLALQRTYNSNDDRIGPFGVGWTHAYDIRMDEAGVNASTLSEQTKRTDFFGAKHTYNRDADGLYTPPSYMFDELSSNYDLELASGPVAPLDDSQKGMDGTVKHFIDGGTNADGSVNHNERVCDSITDRHGNQTVLTYGLTVTMAGGAGKKLLTKVTDPSGRSLLFTWTDLSTTAGAPAFRITQVQGPVDPSGNAVAGVTYRVVYGYGSNASNADTYQNVTSVTLDPDGVNRNTTYGYTNCSGTTYDSMGNAVSDTENGLLASITDPLGHTMSYGYVVGSYLFPYVYCCEMDEPGGVDPSTGTPRVHHWKNLIVTDSVNPGFFQVFDDDHNAGGDNSDGYFGVYLDQYGRFECYTSSAFTLHYNAYDNANNVLQSRDEFQAWKHAYDIARYSTATYGPHGNMLTQSMDGFSGQAATAYYNASKYFQKASVTDLNGRTSSFDYYDDNDVNIGERGEVKQVQDANYASTGAQFTYTYNSLGQKTSETNLNGVVTQYTYGDSLGNLTQVVQDPSNSATGYTGLNRTTSMTYDYAGHVLSSTDPNGNTSTFSYNTLGQPTSASFAATASTSAETIGYSYDANGRTHSVTDNRGTTTMAYESGCDRVSSVTDPVTGTVSYTYGLAGERDSVTYPDGQSATYGYAAPGIGTLEILMPKDDPNSVTRRPVSITDGSGRRVDIDTQFTGGTRSLHTDELYDSSGNLLKSLYTTYTEDGIYSASKVVPYSHGWLTDISTSWLSRPNAGTSFTTSLLHENDYTYDAVGQRQSNTVSTPDATSGGVDSRTESYGYDNLNRLTSVDYGDGQTQGYSFDAMGNRATKTDSSTGNESYGYDAANRLTSRTVSGTTHTVTSDANGNTLSDGECTNTWDSQNRLVSCASSAGGSATTSTFTYGSDGLRRRGTVTASDGTKTRTDYIYDGTMMVEQVIQHFNSSGTALDTPTTITYLQGPSGPLYRKSSAVADPSWYVYDGLGSVVGEVDVNGNMTAGKLFDVYGLTRSYSGSPKTRQGFVGGLGHESDDETGLVYMRARYYDPGTGRFISEDPGVHGSNWFTYCNNDPINFRDSTGKDPTADAMSAFLAVLATSVDILSVLFACLGNEKLAGILAIAAIILMVAANGVTGFHMSVSDCLYDIVDLGHVYVAIIEAQNKLLENDEGAARTYGFAALVASVLETRQIIAELVTQDNEPATQ